ncbi:sulfotransferase domain-containing protein [Pleurocapsa sp. PCC 7319]|uniref:sulfotransferase domain-containing protein n=1 Tax=Pleurocapsa sp. PCC 7319 TaxID=118161 RepID=UPI00034D4B36|nr:sulfotransferase domain-containing protein [Pleurocapsa sp. PCC 7319]
MTEQLLDSTVQNRQSLAVAEIIRLPINQDIFHGYNIGEPTKGLFIVNSRLMISGWVVGKTAVKSVEVVCKNRVLQKIPTSYHRGDLSKLYGDLAKEQKTSFGFRDEIVLDPNQIENELTINAVFGDGKRVPIIIVKLERVSTEDLLTSNLAPDFMVIGAMKAATSAIYSYLVKHPQVIQRAPKEIHYFSYHYDKGLEWYLSHFTRKKEVSGNKNYLIGEASPSYLHVKHVPKRVKEHFPYTKLIVCLRNPTERAISQYYHHVNRVGDETRTIEEVFSEAEINRVLDLPPDIKHDTKKISNQIEKYGNTLLYLWLGEYVDQIKNWLDFFPAEQILVLQYEDLQNQSQKFIEKLFSFLDLNDNLPREVSKIYASKYPVASTSVVQRLDNYYGSYNEALDVLLKRNSSLIK